MTSKYIKYMIFVHFYYEYLYTYKYKISNRFIIRKLQLIINIINIVKNVELHLYYILL